MIGKGQFAIFCDDLIKEHAPAFFFLLCLSHLIQ